MRLLSFFSYLDPGTGSIIFQSIIGVAAGIAVFGRKALYRVVSKTKSPFKHSSAQSHDDEEADTEKDANRSQNA